VTWAVKPGASLADLATIDLRRITDVLQVDHASLFLRDPYDPQRAAVVAETGLPVSEALPEHRMLLSDVLQSGCAAELQRPGGAGAPASAALATPLLHEDRAVGAVLVVTRRESRCLGAIDAQVIQRATRALVERFLTPGVRPAPRVESDRFTRDAPASHR
jgi:GAF domain